MSTGFEQPRGAGRDPRSIITPDAFVVAQGLLGTPLAAPGRRLMAILVDLMVIGVLTALTQSFALVLGVVVAVLFIRAGFKRVAVPGSAWGRAMRASVGCLGVGIGVVTLGLWTAFGVDLGRSDQPAAVVSDGVVLDADLATTVLATTSGIAFARAPDLETARAAGARLVSVGRDLGLPDDEISEVILDLVPDDAPWAADADELVTSLVAGGATPADAGATTEADTAASEAVQAVQQPDSAALLATQVEALAVELREAREAAAAAQASDSGLLAGLRGFLDDLGFGFGWASLYFTVLLTWWKGQTVGKRLMGIRVVRLDGEPITWWTGFERAGGYAAGFATGLLGFAQVYWDANRQAIHDRIVGTVVVREGAPKVLDWESAL